MAQTDRLEELLDQLPEEVNNSNWPHDTFKLHISSGLSEGVRYWQIVYRTEIFHERLFSISHATLRETVAEALIKLRTTTQVKRPPQWGEPGWIEPDKR